MGAAGSVGGRAEAALRGGQKEGKAKGQTDGQKDEEEEKRSEASESMSTPERRTGALTKCLEFAVSDTGFLTN
eukprot:1542107-Pleurochrysis_carterae.AAC.2